MAKKNHVTIILPTYNEASNIKIIIPKITKVMKSTTKKPFEIFVVDDNSPDGTGEIAEKLSKKYPVRVIHRTKNKGYGESCKEGFKLALKNSEYIVTMDCDLSHNPESIPQMMQKAKQGYDIVVGSRYIKGGKIENWGLHRRIMSKGANTFTRYFLGIPINDCTSGFRYYKAGVLKSIDLGSIRSNGYSFLEEIMYKCYKKGFKIAQVPIVYKERVKGKSKLSKKELYKFLFTILKLRILHRK